MKSIKKSEATKALWRQRTPEWRAEHRRKLSEGMQRYWDSIRALKEASERAK